MECNKANGHFKIFFLGPQSRPKWQYFERYIVDISDDRHLLRLGSNQAKYKPILLTVPGTLFCTKIARSYSILLHRPIANGDKLN